MTKTSRILNLYLFKEFTIKFLGFFLILMGVVYLFEVIELIKRSSGHDAIGFMQISALALYKLPDAGQQILPFIVLFASMATLWGLSRRQELVCLRSSGMSVWQFLSPIMVASLLLGILYITILHPISAASINKYEKLKSVYFGNGVETITVIDDGLWLKQTDNTGNFILKAETLNTSNWIMNNVSVFFFDSNNIHTQRIDAATAQLKPNEWVFSNVQVHRTNEAPAFLPKLILSTTLTSEVITESFSNPQTISFWKLPKFIKALGETGLDTIGMKIYYQSLLSQPLLLLSMILMSAAVTLRTERFSRLLPVISGGLGLGFVVFFLSGFLRALGTGHEIPILLASWTVPLIIILFSVSFLAKLEDG